MPNVPSPPLDRWRARRRPAAAAETQSPAAFAGLSSNKWTTPADAATALGADTTVAETGLTGAGVTIGIISDSFDVAGQASTAEVDGELPSSSSLHVLSDSSSGRDEGLAMAEVAHDVAPGAGIAFAQSGGTLASFAQAVSALQAAGCKIICDDVSFGNEPFFQPGGVAQTAIANFIASGGSFFTAASNAGPKSAYQATFSGLAATLPGVGAVTAMNFGTSSAPQTTDALTLKAGRPTTIDLQWAQPWASLDGHGAAYSLGYAIYDPSGNLVKLDDADKTGGDPLQYDTFTPTVSGTYTVAVFCNHGTDPGDLFKIEANNNSSTPAAFAGSQGGSIFGHEAFSQAITVGAVDAHNTPAYGGHPKSESFSAAGPVTQVFDQNGNKLSSPKTLHPVSISGPDGQATTLSSPDLNPFYGTSAAAPAVAAVGALMLEADPSLDQAEIQADLQGTALAFGKSDQAGAGLAQAQGAVALARESNTLIHADLFDTGTSAVIWQAPGHGARLSQVASDAIVSTSALAAPTGTGWTAVATGDFAGAPGERDILWQNQDGRLAIEAMAGGTASPATDLPAGSTRGWTVVGTGDFDGSGTSDILLRNSAGAVEIDSVQQGQVVGTTELQGPGAGWTAKAIGDFEATGTSDILWQSDSGALALWMMNGTSVAQELSLARNPGSDWSVAGVGDFDATGHSEILLRNAQTAALQIWSVNPDGSGTATTLSGGPGAAWQVAGTGEFGTSGHAGILFSNPITGASEIGEVRHGKITLTALKGPGASFTPGVF